MFVGSRIHTDRLSHQLKIERFEQRLDALLQGSLGPNGDNFVFIHKDIKERLFRHRTETAHSIFIEKPPELAKSVYETIDTKPVVGDVRVDLAETVVAEEVENRVHPPRHHRKQLQNQCREFLAGDDDIEHIPVGPFFEI